MDPKDKKSDMPLPAYIYGREAGENEKVWTEASVLARDAQWQSLLDAAIAAERERISDEISDALQSDLEHGVKWLSEVAADNFKESMPQLCSVIAAIRASRKEST